MTKAAVRQTLSSGHKYGYFMAGTGTARGMRMTLAARIHRWLKCGGKRELDWTKVRWEL